MEEELLELMQVNLQLEKEKNALERQNEHLRSLLAQMQELELNTHEKQTKKKRQSPKWVYFQNKRTDPELLEMISKRHNLEIIEIPWQLIKRETDKQFQAKNLTQ